MSPQLRALLIGMLGPALQAAGGVWDLLEHGVFSPVEAEQITLTHLLSDPAHLLIFTGFALAVVCIPVAIQVAMCRAEEIEPGPAEADEDVGYGLQHAGGSR